MDGKRQETKRHWYAKHSLLAALPKTKNGISLNTRRLTYWLVYAALICLKPADPFLIFWLQLWHSMKWVGLCWLMIPESGGTQWVLTKVVRPFYGWLAEVVVVGAGAKANGGGGARKSS